MKLGIALLGATLFGIFGIQTVESIELPQGYVSSSYSLENTVEIVSQSMRPRGSEEEMDMATFISDTLESFGYESDIMVEPFMELTWENSGYGDLDFEEMFNLNPEGEDIPDGYFPIVSATKYAMDNPTNQKLILITSHDTSSDAKSTISSGSGIATTLEIANLLKDEELPFDLEVVSVGTNGLYAYGTRTYVNNISEEETETIVGAISVQGLGYLQDSEFVMGDCFGVGSVFTQIADNLNLDVNWDRDANQTMVFQAKNIPAVGFKEEPLEWSGVAIRHYEGELDVDKLEKAATTIAKFISNYDLEKHNELLKGELIEQKDIDYYVDKIIDIDEHLCGLSIAKLLENGHTINNISTQLIENGITNNIILAMEDENNNEYTITRVPGDIYNVDNLYQFDMLGEPMYENWERVYVPIIDDETKLIFKGSQYTLVFEGDIDEQDIIEIAREYLPYEI
ncbi:MAG: hypothetical protein ATN36_04925 [Epulopiscium sp. Nele67-Bin005]|nr:MAG: hypothetical protein ATN36_04925 [Epulopiscium sp. Nele67-Bin005]